MSAQLATAGGADMLKQECNSFINLYSHSGGSKYMWTPNDTKFPPAIASFHPQSIRISIQGTKTYEEVIQFHRRIEVRAQMVDLCLADGPPKRGLIVAIPQIGKLPPDFMPNLGTNYTVRMVTNGVFEYHN